MFTTRFAQADIVLLDDILAALDVHTARWVVDKCLNGHLLAGRTVLLVTHNLAIIGGLAERVVVVSSQGVASVCETTHDAITHDPPLRSDTTEGDNVLGQKLDKRTDEPNELAMPASCKLIAGEEVAIGHVSFFTSEAENTSRKASKH
jgi:ABC-type nitrate/sulfonate/bicarbonate transport system ATPase subunit